VAVLSIGILRHERVLRWEFDSVIPDSVRCTSIEMPAGKDLRSFFKQLDIRSLVRMRSQNQIPLRHRIAAAQIRAAGVKVMLTTDRDVEFLNSLAQLCPDVQQILVGHGVIVPMLVKRLRVTYAYPNRVVCVWGQREVDVVRQYASPMLNLFVLGSLRNSSYLANCRILRTDRTHLQRKICLVSSFVGEKKEAELAAKGSVRSQSADMVTEHVRRVALKWGVPVVVALKPPTMQHYREGVNHKWAAEMQYFKGHLEDCDVSFTDPNDRYSTYRAIDESVVSFGRFMSSIVEGFGRGSLVRSIGPNVATTGWGALPNGLHLSEAEWNSDYELGTGWIDDLATKIQGNDWLERRQYYLHAPLDESPIGKLSEMISKYLG